MVSIVIAIVIANKPSHDIQINQTTRTKIGNAGGWGGGLPYKSDGGDRQNDLPKRYQQIVLWV